MKTIVDWLDEAKTISGSDYMTAKRIGVTRQAISKARKKKQIRPETAGRLAAFLKVDPAAIMGSAVVEKHPEEAIYWQKWIASVCLPVSALLLINQGVINGLTHILYRLCKKGKMGQRERLAL